MALPFSASFYHACACGGPQGLSGALKAPARYDIGRRMPGMQVHALPYPAWSCVWAHMGHTAAAEGSKCACWQAAVYHAMNLSEGGL